MTEFNANISISDSDFFDHVKSAVFEFVSSSNDLISDIADAIDIDHISDCIQNRIVEDDILDVAQTVHDRVSEYDLDDLTDNVSSLDESYEDLSESFQVLHAKVEELSKYIKSLEDDIVSLSSKKKFRKKKGK